MREETATLLLWPEVLQVARRASDHYSLSEREQELLFEVAMGLPTGALIVELGVCNGKTALILAAVAEAKQGLYIGVDNWSLEGSFGEVFDLMHAAFGTSRWQLWQGDTHTIELPAFPIDLLLIDAGHQEEAVSVDCERWIPTVRPGGIVAFDDYPGERNWRDSCHWAVREYGEMWTEGFDLVAYWGKIMVRRKPL